MKQCTGTYDSIEISYIDNFAVSFLYNSFPGRVLLNIFVRPSVSSFIGFLMDQPVSGLLIRGFIKRNGINMNEYEMKKYKSFNDFFSRKIKKELRPFPDNEYDIGSPCDGKLTAFPINEDSIFYIKNSVYSIHELLQDKVLASEFINGICLIFRLTTDDYHRYSYIDDGNVMYCKRIQGVLHTVRPISHQSYKIYTQNTREYTVIQTKNFGKVIQMEVGALLVGRITNHETRGTVKRSDEKGMFEFGGSTIVMIFQNDTIEIDHTIYENTKQAKETIVKMGCKIGIKMNNKERSQ